MIEVQINLVPFGREADKSTIQRVYIANMGEAVLKHRAQGTWRRYHAWFADPRDSEEVRANPVVALEHMREDGALVLLQKVLNRTILNKRRRGPYKKKR